MADNKVPETLLQNPQLINRFRELFGEYIDENNSPVKGKEAEAKALLQEIYQTTGIPEKTPVKQIGITLEGWYEMLQQGTETTTEISEYQEISNTTPTPDQLAELIKAEEIQSEKLKKTREWSSETVEAGIKRQQEIYQEQVEKIKAAEKQFEKEQKFARVKVADLPEEQQKEIDELTQKAKVDPRGTVEALSKDIQSRAPEIPKEAADLTALYVVGNLQTGYVPLIQTKVVQTLAKDPKIAGEKGENVWVSYLSDSKKSTRELAEEILTRAYGTNPLPTEVELSDTPQSGFSPVSLATIPREGIKLIEQKNSVLQNPYLEAPKYWESSFGSQLAGLEGDGSVRGISLHSFNSQGASIPSSGITVKLNQATGITEPLNIVGGLAKGAVKKGAVKAITGFIGKALGPETLGLSVVVEKALGWLADHIDLKKLKKYSLFVLSIPVIGAGLVFSIPALVLGGGALGAVGLGMGAGMTAATFGAGIGGFFSAVGAATLGAIGIPILVTLLVFPVVVALILFIINSGAYVVPPSPASLNAGKFSSPYVDVTKTTNQAGPLENSDLPKEVTYTITIKPKKGDLTNVQLSYDCQVISKANLSCPEIELSEGNENIFTAPLEKISVTGLTFTYTSTYGNQFRDSAIIDSIKLNAISNDGNQVATETSADVQFGTPPISCPILGGQVASPTLNFSFNQSNNTGHGSQAYWQAMEQSPSAYSLPQSTGCQAPTQCSYYGYAYDVFPTGSKDVYAPTVLGKDVTWNCSYGFANRASGNTYICTGGGYTLVLTHMSSGAKTGSIKSGEKIGTLFNQLGNTHLHIEFQINGRYVKPETYFCGGK